MFVVFVWFCCSSLLAFLKMANLINLMRPFFTPLSYLRWRQSFCSYIFLKINWKILEILSVVHLVDIYAKRVGTLCANAHYRASLYGQSLSRYSGQEKLDYDIVITAETLYGSQITTGKHQTFGEAQALIEATLCFEFGREAVGYQNLTKLPWTQ